MVPEIRLNDPEIITQPTRRSGHLLRPFLATLALFAGTGIAHVAHAQQPERATASGFVNACRPEAGPVDLEGFAHTFFKTNPEGRLVAHLGTNMQGRNAAGITTTLTSEFTANLLGGSSGSGFEAIGRINTGGTIDASRIIVRRDANGNLVVNSVDAGCIGKGIN